MKKFLAILLLSSLVFADTPPPSFVGLKGATDGTHIGNTGDAIHVYQTNPQSNTVNQGNAGAQSWKMVEDNSAAILGQETTVNTSLSTLITRLNTIITNLANPFQAGGAISNTGFNVNNFPSGFNVNNFPAFALENGGHLASLDAKVPASPSQEHVTALSPNACRLSDGAAFYTGFKNGDLIGNTGFNVNNFPPFALDSSLLAFKSANHTDLAQVDTDVLAFKTSNHTDLLSLATSLASILANQTNGTQHTIVDSGTVTANIGTTGGLALDASISTVITRLNTLITAVGSPFQAGGLIGNTAFGRTWNLIFANDKVDVSGSSVSVANPITNFALETGGHLANIDTTTQQIDTDIKASQPRKMQDGAGNALTSQVSGSQRPLDTQILFSGTVINPTQIRTISSSTDSIAVPGSATASNQTTELADLSTEIADLLTLITNTTGLATASNQTNGTQKTQRVDGAGNVSPAGDTNARGVFVKPGDGTNVQAYTNASEAKVLETNSASILTQVTNAAASLVTIISNTTGLATASVQSTISSTLTSILSSINSILTNQTNGAQKHQAVDGTGAVQGPYQSLAGTNYAPVVLASSATNGAAVPARSVLISGSDGTNARNLRTDTAGFIQENARIDTTATGTLSSAGPVISISGNGVSEGRLAVSGTFVGTLQVQGVSDLGVTTNLATLQTTWVNTGITAPGTFKFRASDGFASVQVVFTSFTSGSASIALRGATTVSAPIVAQPNADNLLMTEKNSSSILTQVTNAAASLVSILADMTNGTQITQVSSQVNNNDRTATGNITAVCTDANINACGAGSTVQINSQGAQSVIVQHLGTWVAVVVFDTSSDGGTTWQAQRSIDIDTNDLTQTWKVFLKWSQAQAADRFAINPAGAPLTRLRASAFTSGTINVALTASQGALYQLSVAAKQFDYSVTGNITAVCTDANINACTQAGVVGIPSEGMGSVNFQHDGTWVAVVVIDGSNDATSDIAGTWEIAESVDRSANNIADSFRFFTKWSQTRSADRWNINPGGYKRVRLRAATFTSGTINVTETASPIPAYYRVPQENYTFTHISGNATTVVKSSPAILRKICVNSAVAGATITVQDQTSNATPTIAVITEGQNNNSTWTGNCMNYDGLVTATGLTVVTAGNAGGDITVVYK